MQSFPHQYRVAARAGSEGEVALDSAGLPPLASAGPAEFGGPGDRWSPETLLVGAVADCYVLSLRAVAEASKVAWTSIDCRAEGTLDRVERTTRFTQVALHVELVVPPETELAKAERVLEKAKSACLISNSLACPVTLEKSVRQA
ncbi:MAG: OsmC family protein [Deltaproteobacteria bacterium]|nr:OsmC family protein [Deltaproteobacteria bacterium]